MLHHTMMHTNGLKVRIKSGGGANQEVGAPSSIIELCPEDFPLIDQVPEYASAANQYVGQQRRRPFPGRYFGGDIKDHATLVNMLENGWQGGVDRIVALSDKLRSLVPMPKGVRRRVKWCDQGDEIDMAKVYAGQLDTAWRSMPRQRTQAPRVISIDADVGQQSNVGAEQLFWAGATAVALTDALESAGYRVELFATSCGLIETDNSLVMVRVRVKEAQQPLNLSLAASMVAHPATFRWYHLMARLKHPVCVQHGFGRSCYLGPVLEEAASQGLIEGAELQLDECLSEAAAVAEAKSVIERLCGDQDNAEGTIV